MERVGGGKVALLRCWPLGPPPGADGWSRRGFGVGVSETRRVLRRYGRWMSGVSHCIIVLKWGQVRGRSHIIHVY